MCDIANEHVPTKMTVEVWKLELPRSCSLPHFALCAVARSGRIGTTLSPSPPSNAAAAGEDPMRVYNLFRRKGANALYCAVPEDITVPSFVTDERWEFSGKVEAGSHAPVGFDIVAAEAGARFNGFYIFQTV